MTFRRRVSSGAAITASVATYILAWAGHIARQRFRGR